MGCPVSSRGPVSQGSPYSLQPGLLCGPTGRTDEAWDLLHKAMEIADDVTLVKKMALADKDLKALHDRIEKM